MRRRTIAASAAMAAVLVTAGMGVGSGDDSAGFLLPDNPVVVGLGERIYDSRCAACHGSSLEGAPNWRERGTDGLLPAPPHDETGHTWHHPDAQLFAITKYGTAAVVGGGYRSAMMGFGDVLTDDEIVAVLSYIKSTWPAQIRAVHDERNEAFEATLRP